MEQKKEKADLRKQLRERLAALSETYLKQADWEIGQRIRLLEEYQQAKTLFCFVGVGREINTQPIILEALAAGKRVALPRCVGKGVMEAYLIHDLTELEAGSYGLLEPASHCLRIDPWEISFALVPCLSCDREGYRLGQGGGYYDRYLKQAAFKGAVLCREQMLSPKIPHLAYDVALPLVITETAVYRIG